MADPYEILGVSREATQSDIRKAYHRLAKKSHPDLHPGDKSAEARFKDIASAYDIVGDDKKRERFDAGEIDATGAERAPRPEREFYRRHAESPSGFKYDRTSNGAGLGDEDLFAEFFGARGGRSSAHSAARGADLAYTFSVELIEAACGAKKRVVMADGKTLDITIPGGLMDGQTIRLRGQGHPGRGGADPGDARVHVHVKSHPFFRREGNDIHSVLPVTPGEAMAGGKLRVATVWGAVQLGVPKGSNSGSILRMRGKGVATTAGHGDHLVELRVILPDQPDDAFVQSIVDWESKHPYDPRKQQEAQS
jgi:DnaJ-class molecular chaperone